jgi:hypothetical protein
MIGRRILETRFAHISLKVDPLLVRQDLCRLSIDHLLALVICGHMHIQNALDVLVEAKVLRELLAVLRCQI